MHIIKKLASSANEYGTRHKKLLVQYSEMFQHISDTSTANHTLLNNKAPYSAYVGYFSSYFPAELLYGFNVHPVRILGGAKNITPKRALMNYMCSYLADVISIFEAGHFSCIDHLILPATCDSMYGAKDYIEKSCVDLKTKMFGTPLKFTKDTYGIYESAVKEVLKWLSNEYSFDSELLRKGLEERNHMNSAIRKMLSPNGELFEGAVYLKLMMAKSVLPYHVFMTLTHEMEKEVLEQNYRQKQKNILTLGPVCDNLDMIDYLNQKHNLLTKFMTTSLGAYDGEVVLKGDVKSNLIKYYFDKAGTVTSYDYFNVIIEDLVYEIRKYSIKGIVYINYKFCEPHMFFSRQLKKYLENSDVKILYLETEHAKGMDALIQNKIDTFLETI